MFAKEVLGVDTTQESWKEDMSLYERRQMQDFQDEALEVARKNPQLVGGPFRAELNSISKSFASQEDVKRVETTEQVPNIQKESVDAFLFNLNGGNRHTEPTTAKEWRSMALEFQIALRGSKWTSGAKQKRMKNLIPIVGTAKLALEALSLSPNTSAEEAGKELAVYNEAAKLSRQAIMDLINNDYKILNKYVDDEGNVQRFTTEFTQDLSLNLWQSRKTYNEQYEEFLTADPQDGMLDVLENGVDEFGYPFDILEKYKADPKKYSPLNIMYVPYSMIDVDSEEEASIVRGVANSLDIPFDDFLQAQRSLYSANIPLKDLKIEE